MSPAADPVALAAALIRCRSVTPADDGAQDVLAAALAALGFTVTRLPFGEAGAPTPNLFARLGEGAPHVCFAGHTDVVPPGDHGWSVDPFAGTVRDGRLYGRGAVDMKGAIAAFVAAVSGHLADGRSVGTISLLITGDEEGPAIDGTARVVDWLAATGQMPDFCLVGEPTNPRALGDTIKVGRRGSLSVTLTVPGIQGHVAYPDRVDNPVHRLVGLLAELVATPLDAGSPHFAPSGLQVTSIDVGNAARNVVPAQATARLNIRYNDCHDATSLTASLREAALRHAPGAELDIVPGAAPFLAASGPETAALMRAIRDVTGRDPRLDTDGGTSDARFLAPYCRVAEFGLVGETMHAANENATVADLRMLAAIYRRLLAELMQKATHAA